MKQFVLIVLFLGVFVSVAFGQDNVEWKKVAENNYINPETIIGTEEFYGYIFMLKAYNKGQYEPVNGKNISYTLSQYVIDCGRNSYKIGLMDSYDIQGNFVNGDYNRYAKFQPIVGGTAVGSVAQKLCRPID